MALLRSVRTSFNNSYRKLSQSNVKNLNNKRSHFIRSYTTNRSPFIAKKLSNTSSAYKYLSSSYKALNRRLYGQQHFYYPSPYPNQAPLEVHATTIICVRKGDEVVLCGDGQMTIGNVVAKSNGRKLRKLNNEKAVCGFAGGAADGITLVDLLEKKLSERDELRRACVETSKMWRTDKILRHLNAVMIVADEKSTYQLTGTGELVESDTGIMAIGSGGQFAEAAARALIDREDLSADDIAKKAMQIAGDMCIYTNHNTMKLRIEKGKGIVEDTTGRN